MHTNPHDFSNALETNTPPELAAYLARTDPVAHADVHALFEEMKSPATPSAFSRRATMGKGGWALTTQITKEQTGVLRTVRDGKRVLTTAPSLFEHLIERVIASHPAETAPPRRKPTENELKGLERGNARRVEEARQRREAKMTEVSVQERSA
jgi:hypothetical protein